MTPEELAELRMNVQRRRGSMEFEEEGLACDVEMLCNEVERLTKRVAELEAATEAAELDAIERAEQIDRYDGDDA